ncbi:dual 3',5'-cyclic-AMP and -GMP phosphodiesterase 11-like isoform X3 [Hyalella azteca]|uniref:Phosphodiesterase n=1 Tax=Hyalella azteca TaxID=294128 RepID=A0A8B7PBV2_HYAAZ|nr:dual 3',5'-cyclic-AMP and -GMP phosphodiesterase 11-like isoform X3 [Hyalella azteca]
MGQTSSLANVSSRFSTPEQRPRVPKPGHLTLTTHGSRFLYPDDDRSHYRPTLQATHMPRSCDQALRLRCNVGSPDYRQYSLEYEDVTEVVQGSDDLSTRFRWHYWRTQAWRPRNSPEQTVQLHSPICCLGVCCCCKGWKGQHGDGKGATDDSGGPGDDRSNSSPEVPLPAGGGERNTRAPHETRRRDAGAVSPGVGARQPPSPCDPEYTKIEAWLDEHPDFAQDYFIRKASRHMVDSWLVSHALPQHIAQALSSSEGAAPPASDGAAAAAQGSKASSGATTPVRKISAHEFEKGGLVKPIVTTIDGTPTFLSPSPHDHHLALMHKVRRKSRPELKGLDERELIFMLVKDIFNELDIRSLCHKILQNVSILTRADRCSLFLVQGEKDSPNRCLVSTLFDVSPDSTVEEMHEKEEIRIPWGSGIIGYVGETGAMLNIPDAYQDARFNHDVDAMTGYKTRSLLCMPIIDSSYEVIGVAQVINKKDGSCFTHADEKVFESYLQFCGISIKNAQLYERSQLEVKRNQVLLDLARIIFEEQSTIEQMVYRIMIHMQSLLQCVRVQILLTDERHSFSRVFDLEVNDMEAEDAETRTSPYEWRFPINIGITGLVANTGQTINIPDAYADERFDQETDKGTNFRHRSILCQAIRNTSGKILGVVQLINKFDNLAFTKNDENFLEAFAIFCGMGLHNTHMYEKAMTAIAKQNVTLDVLSYHATASKELALELKACKVPPASVLRLHDFKFDDFSLDDDGTLKACLRMFTDLDLIQRFHIDELVLCRWLLSVKKNYRDVTYHNWRHAFNVAQMMFVILTKTKWWKVLGEMECVALIIACLCHDLDHRGTNNSFQIRASSPLAQLYSTSTMEHHHFDQSLMILNTSGNRILSQCTSEEFSRIVAVLEEAILATDLAVYFKKRPEFFKLVSSGEYDWCKEEHRSQLRAMTMTACDIAAITKPWEVQKKVAELVANEFFEQGDIEKEKLKITPIDMMNRDKRDKLPAMQVNFIDTICLPVYENLAEVSSDLQPLLDGVKANRARWEALAAESCPENNNSLPQHRQ